MMKYGTKPATAPSPTQQAAPPQAISQETVDCLESCDDALCGPGIIRYIVCCFGCCTNYDEWYENEF
jgi:hypothetical protein